MIIVNVLGNYIDIFIIHTLTTTLFVVIFVVNLINKKEKIMGLFSFVKNAGSKLFGRKTDATTEKPEMSEYDMNMAKAVELINAVQSYEVDIQDLSVTVDGDKATINGTACCTEDKEKAILIVGNVAGIAEVEDNIIVTQTDEENNEVAPAPLSVFHTVVSGDSLSKISLKYYGNAMKYPVIFEANKPMLTHPDKIYPGQVLRVPELEA